jgi:hypothetical protein
VGEAGERPPASPVEVGSAFAEPLAYAAPAVAFV